jgi:hypothetical protein
MSPANPRYVIVLYCYVGVTVVTVGKGDNICGGEVVFTIPEINHLLSGHSEDAQRWLTTSQMGWALTRERNELTNERDERDKQRRSAAPC